MQNEISPHLILVLGCHRSGTSLLVNSLKCLGVELGEDAEWNGPDNPKSFGEDRYVMALDDRVLMLMGTAWDTPLSIPVPETLLSPQTDLVQKATGLLRLRLARHPVFGLKDPRLCRLLPFWKPILEHLGCRVSVVHVVRHPTAVAKSLARRDLMPLEQGYDLWLDHNQALLRDINPAWPRVVVSYEHMMTLPMHNIARVGAATGLKSDAKKESKFIREFMDDALWHEVEEAADPLPTEVGILWETLRHEALT